VKCWAGWSIDCQEKYQQPQLGRWYHPMAESEKDLNSFLMKVKEGSEKAGLKLNIHKTKIIVSGPIQVLPSIFPSIWVLSNELALRIWWPKYWSFIFSISSSDEYSGLISFRIDWFDLLAVQGTLKSLLQHHCSKASMLQCSAFFMVQLSHTYLTRWTFVSKVMSLLNTLSLS